LGVTKGQPCRIHPAERDVLNGTAREPNPGALEHRCGQIDGHHATVGWILHGAQTGTDADLENRFPMAGCQARQRMTPARCEGDAVNQVINGGESLIDSLDSLGHARPRTMPRSCDKDSATRKNRRDAAAARRATRAVYLESRMLFRGLRLPTLEINHTVCINK